jgi:hypothetical protein
MQDTMRAAGALLLVAAFTQAQAQAVYRCGNAYQAQPCADAKPVDTGPGPTPAERAQAAANTRRDAQLADALQKDRLRQEAQAGNAFYVQPPPFEPEKPSAYRSPEKAATRKLDVFTATAPGTVHAKKAAKEEKKKDAKAAPAAKGSVQPAKPAAKGS